MRDHHRSIIESGVWRVMVDIAMTLVAALIILIALSLSQKKKEQDPSAGQLLFEMTWESRRNIDMDLWVRDPAGRWVGFSSKSSPLCNLLRDDLGNVLADRRFGENIEHTYCRGSQAGDTYVVNVHVYSDKETGAQPGSPLSSPVMVRVRVLWSPTFQSDKRVILDVRFEVDEVGAEYGVAEIRIVGAGNDAPVDADVVPAPMVGVTTDRPIPVPLVPYSSG